MKKSFNKFTILITLLICMLPFLNVAATDNNQLLPFVNSVEVDDLTIMIDDPNGIIPNGAFLDVKKVKQKKNILDFSNNEELKIDKSEYEDIQNAVEELKEENSKDVEESYILDISIKDSNGKEIEPNDSVKLIFKKQNTNQALVANVYHIVDDGNNKQAELLTSETRIENNESITVTETDSFSYYQIEFTYNELQYIMPNDTEEDGIINLKTILDYVGLTGDVQNVRVSNDELYSVEKNEEGEWIIIAHKPFSTKEHTYVTINDVEYDIITTDFFVREGYVLNNCGATATKITIKGGNSKSYSNVANNSSVGDQFPG